MVRCDSDQMRADIFTKPFIESGRWDQLMRLINHVDVSRFWSPPSVTRGVNSAMAAHECACCPIRVQVPQAAAGEVISLADRSAEVMYYIYSFCDPETTRVLERWSPKSCRVLAADCDVEMVARIGLPIFVILAGDGRCSEYEADSGCREDNGSFKLAID